MHYTKLNIFLPSAYIEDVAETNSGIETQKEVTVYGIARNQVA